MDAGRICRVWGLGLGLFFAAPLGYLVYENVRLRSDVAGILAVARTWGPLGNSLLLAAAVSVAAMVAGTALAWATVRVDLPGRRLWAALAPLPLVIPTFVGATAFIALLARGGLAEQHPVAPRRRFDLPRNSSGFWAAWLVSSRCSPIPTSTCRPGRGCATWTPAYEEAARVLGSPTDLRVHHGDSAGHRFPPSLPGECWCFSTRSRTSVPWTCSATRR